MAARLIKNILVTGGAGYIGSHILLELLKKNYEVIVVDNFSNSYKEALKRVEKISSKKITLVELDLQNFTDIKKVFTNNKIDAVIHLAGLKAVGESVEIPLDYYQNNILSTINLLQAMKIANCKNIIFSSSATVYGGGMDKALEEGDTLKTCNPYGRSKLIQEKILKDLYTSNNSWNISILRYFNPVGCHNSGLLGENPKNKPNNLFPIIVNHLRNTNNKLYVFGNDYNTEDGTGVRDYLHVEDLAIGHIKAVEKLQGLDYFNLGTGRGYSVLEVIAMFEQKVNKKINYEITKRRYGDVASVYANPDKANKILNWQANKELENMVQDSFRWLAKNPNGYL